MFSVIQPSQPPSTSTSVSNSSTTLIPSTPHHQRFQGHGSQNYYATPKSHPIGLYKSSSAALYTPTKPSPLSPRSKNALTFPPTPATTIIYDSSTPNCISSPTVKSPTSRFSFSRFQENDSPATDMRDADPLPHTHDQEEELREQGQNQTRSSPSPALTFNLDGAATPSFAFGPFFSPPSSRTSSTAKAEASFRSRAEDASPISRIFNRTSKNNSLGASSSTSSSKNHLDRKHSSNGGKNNPRVSAFLNRIRRERDDDRFENRGEQLLRMDWLKEKRRWEERMAREAAGGLSADMDFGPDDMVEEGVEMFLGGEGNNEEEMLQFIEEEDEELMMGMVPESGEMEHHDEMMFSQAEQSSVSQDITGRTQTHPSSLSRHPSWDSDDEYDRLFMDVLGQEEQQQQHQQGHNSFGFVSGSPLDADMDMD